MTAIQPPRDDAPTRPPRRLLVTGLGGTLAPVLARAAQARGDEVLRWRRDAPGFDPEAEFERLRPDAVAHLGMGDAAGCGRLAALAHRAGLPFLFTSTAMVFHHVPDGPHRPHDARTALDPYGRYKIEAEDAVQAAHPGAAIARLGWQIGTEPVGNNMLATLDGWQAGHGEVAASRAWIPACSFMDDTAEALLRLLGVPGLHHLDSNAQDAWNFHELVLALRERFGRTHWRVRAHADYAHDQRLLGGPALPPLSARLRRPDADAAQAG